VDPWDEKRDARKYAGPWPVVAHPPCQRWINFAALNYKRWGGEHNRPGNDGGCFAAALASVRTHGGVLEHPASSLAWDAFGLRRPPSAGGWVRSDSGWTCCVEQGHYGHRARKATWLYAVGCAIPDLRWGPSLATHQVGWFDRIKPTLSRAEAAATPPAFRDALIAMARSGEGAIAPH
jgi:hypothetical protein